LFIFINGRILGQLIPSVIIICLIIIFYLIWKSTSKGRDSAPDTKSVEKTFTKFQGPGFAQESAKGAVFEYVNYKSGNEVEGPFAIIDFETNGLDKGKHRIIEVAIKRIHKNLLRLIQLLL
jgi:hypothetical protein